MYIQKRLTDYYSRKLKKVKKVWCSAKPFLFLRIMGLGFAFAKNGKASNPFYMEQLLNILGNFRLSEDEKYTGPYGQ